MLGQDLAAGQRPQVVVPPGVWQGSGLEPGVSFALLGATTAPGFDYADYKRGDRDRLIVLYPGQADRIRELTRSDFLTADSNRRGANYAPVWAPAISSASPVTEPDSDQRSAARPLSSAGGLRLVRRMGRRARTARVVPSGTRSEAHGRPTDPKCSASPY